MSTKKITYVVKEEKDSFEIRMDRENEISTVNDLDRGKGWQKTGVSQNWEENEEN